MSYFVKLIELIKILSNSETQPFTQHFGIFRSNNKLVYQSQDYMCKDKNDEYFNHSWYVLFLFFYNNLAFFTIIWRF